MDRLVSAFVQLRRSTRRALPAATATLLSAVVVVHAVHPLGNAVFAGFGLTLAVLLLARGWQRTKAVDQSRWLDLEVGFLLTLCAYAVIVQVDRSLQGSCYPLVYVAIGLVSALCHPAASLGVISIALFFEAALMIVAFGGLKLTLMLPHLLLLLAIGLINMLSLRLEGARLQRASRVELQAERDRRREEARSYRLLRAPSETPIEWHEEEPSSVGRARDEERLLHSGVEEIQLSVLFALRLLRDCLNVHTAMLLWLNDRETHLRISELVSDANDRDLCEGPFSIGDGILGMVLSQRAAVCVPHLKPSYVLPYYRDACPVQSVCAVPVFEHGSLRGVLVVDRCSAEPFTVSQQQLVEQAARLAARAIENERVFVQLERTKVEQGRLYRAAERLGAATSEQEVVDAGVTAASEIATVDFAAFTAYDPETDWHEIRAVCAEDGMKLEGKRFRGNTGLVSMALRNRHPLPYRGQYDGSHQMVFTKRLSPPDLPSLLVLPLFMHDAPLGTLVLGSYEPRAFHEAARNLLEVLASHLAVSLSNARMVRKLEEQATTDGLTGLLNKRTLLETADEKLSAALRFGRPLSVMIADIDLFKRVNDSYGHDVGDIVIKELAAIHQRVKRTTDSVARFGGEEFVTICEQTDAAGALLLAERIRAEFSKTTFHAGGEEVHCTCSVGISTFPEAGSSYQKLFKAADEALYVSKRSGRDRATVWGANRGGHEAA